MWIRCKTDYLDGRDRFNAGELRLVSDERGMFYIYEGWAEEAPSPNLTDLPEAGEGTSTDLDIQSGTLALGDNYG